MKHPFNQQACLERLKQEYDKYGKLIVAFDFDNTIYDFHNNGGDYSEIIELLKECVELHFTLILYTVEEKQVDTLKKVSWLRDKGIINTINDLYINKSPIFPDSKKPYYNILLDDRAGLEECYNILKQVIEYAKNKSN